MNVNKKKLHLKRSIIASIPVIITILILVIFVAVDKSKLSTREINTNENIAKSNFIAEPTAESDNFVLNFIDNVLDNRERENTIIYYAEKYHLDSKKALDIAQNITNNFQSELFVKNHIIGPESIMESEGSFKNEEAGIVYFVRDLFRRPQTYGVTEAEITNNIEVEREKKYENGTIILQSGLTYEQFLGHICDMYDMDKNVVLAISYLESGYLKSFLATNKNNFGGQRSGGVWLEYPTPEAGIIGHVMTIRAILNSYEIDLTQPNAISNLSAVYVYGNPNKPSESWTSKVTYLTEQNKTKELFLHE